MKTLFEIMMGKKNKQRSYPRLTRWSEFLIGKDST